MVITETPRLILRHVVMEDAYALEGVFGDPEVMRFSDGVQTRSWVRAWLQRRLEHDYPARGYGPYSVVEKRSRQVIGYCGLFDFADLDGCAEVEIGYRLVRRCWGKGYATEAAYTVRDHGFQNLGLSRLVAMIDPANVTSIRVAEKLGMRYEKDVMLEGYTYPDHLYAMKNPHTKLAER